MEHPTDGERDFLGNDVNWHKMTLARFQTIVDSQNAMIENLFQRANPKIPASLIQEIIEEETAEVLRPDPKSPLAKIHNKNMCYYATVNDEKRYLNDIEAIYFDHGRATDPTLEIPFDTKTLYPEDDTVIFADFPEKKVKLE